MAVFKVSMRDGSAEAIVRARCLTCARQSVAEHAPADQFKAWCGARVELMRNPEDQGYLSEGKAGIIKWIKHDSKQA